jgi:hypothetical protein
VHLSRTSRGKPHAYRYRGPLYAQLIMEVSVACLQTRRFVTKAIIARNGICLTLFPAWPQGRDLSDDHLHLASANSKRVDLEGTGPPGRGQSSIQMVRGHRHLDTLVPSGEIFYYPGLYSPPLTRLARRTIGL